MSSKLLESQQPALDGGSIGAAGAAALRGVKTLAESAPKGRFFASISTLHEMGGQALKALEAREFERAKHIATELARAGSEAHIPTLIKKHA